MFDLWVNGVIIRRCKLLAGQVMPPMTKSAGKWKGDVYLTSSTLNGFHEFLSGIAVKNWFVPIEPDERKCFEKFLITEEELLS